MTTTHGSGATTTENDDAAFWGALAGEPERRELLIADEIVYGADGYAPRLQLDKAFAANHFSVSWWQGGNIMSGKLKSELGGGLWKNRNRFMPPITEPLLTELEAVGVRQPASYGSCFHALTSSPRVKHTVNAIFNWWPGGPWQEALTTGRHFGKHYRYDLCSAYRWAATLGLPDMSTLKVWEGYTDPQSVNGLWVVTLNPYLTTTRSLPPLFRGSGPVVMSSEDMRLYGVTPALVHRGVTWDRSLSGDYVENTLARLPCPKQVGRAYWGRWIARDKLVCRNDSRSWELPNVVANFVWGMLIISRVRGKVWEASNQALHVYVDEVITPHELPTGEALGDWRLKETYDGIEVCGTGWFGTLAGSRIMRTGVPRLSS